MPCVGVVDHHRELVGPEAVGALEHEVADLVRHVLRAARPAGGRASRDGTPSSPREAPGARRLAVQAVAAGAGVDALGVRAGARRPRAASAASMSLREQPQG